MAEDAADVAASPPSRASVERGRLVTERARLRAMAKTRRIELRADPDSEERIARAAAARQQSVSAFVLSAAVHEADLVLARADVTVMAVEQFHGLIESLDLPDDAPGLTAAAARARRFTRE